MKVNPTRMELLKLRRRIRLAKRGYKLLKDKEEQLLLEFRTLVHEAKKARLSVEKELARFYAEVLKLKGIMDEPAWNSFTGGDFFKTIFHVETKKIFNIPVSSIRFAATPEKLSAGNTAAPSGYRLLKESKDILNRLIELFFLENKLISFASEIERTRRRVNALEYVLMPNLEDTIKFITFKLNEAERSSLVMLKHIKLTRD